MGILGEENLYLLDATLDTWYSVAGAAMVGAGSNSWCQHPSSSEITVF